MTTIARFNWTIKGDTQDKDVVHKNDIRWDYSTGGFAMCNGVEAYAQTIEAVVLTVKGELVTQRDFGIPYFSTIFDNNSRANEWATAVTEIVSALDFVDSIDSFDYAYDPKDKAMHYQMTVTTKDGNTVVAEG